MIETRREADSRWNKLYKKANEAVETVDRNYAAGTNYRSRACIARTVWRNSRNCLAMARRYYVPTERVDRRDRAVAK
ncbi:hypothetical protein SH449x_004132 [Pirellulaceae bacterium SH449]